MREFIENNGGLWSLLGLFLTIFTFIGVFFNRSIIAKLNKRNFKINRMPENLSELKRISNLLSIYLGDFEKNKKKIKTKISNLIPTLKSLKKSLDKDEIDNYSTLKASIANIDKLKIDNENIAWFKRVFYKEKIFTESYSDDIDIKLSRLITDIENIGDDNNKNLIL